MVVGMDRPACPLEVLILSNNELGSPSGEAIGNMLSINTTIKQVDLAWNGIRRTGAVTLANALFTNRTLQRLDIAWNGFGTEGALWCSSPTGHVGALTLPYVGCGTLMAGSEHLGMMLSSNNTLRVLNISHNSVQAQSAIVIANNLKKNTTLTNLQMNGNALGKDGGRALLRCMDGTGDVRIIGLDGEIAPIPLAAS